MIMQLLRISKTLEQSRQEEIEKKCRRCVHIFKSDDFYYFFDNVEEEVKPILDSLLIPAWWVTTISQFPMQNLFVDKMENPFYSDFLYHMQCTTRSGDLIGSLYNTLFISIMSARFTFDVISAK